MRVGHTRIKTSPNFLDTLVEKHIFRVRFPVLYEVWRGMPGSTGSPQASLPVVSHIHGNLRGQAEAVFSEPNLGARRRVR